MSNAKSPQEAPQSGTPDIPTELPPEIALLLPNQEQRDVATLTYRLFSDPDFRTDFVVDPAGALASRGRSADVKLIETLQRMDKVVLDKMVENYKSIFDRTGAFKWEPSPEPRTVTQFLVLAYVAGVASHLLVHRVLQRGARDI